MIYCENAERKSDEEKKVEKTYNEKIEEKQVNNVHVLYYGEIATITP